MWHHDLRSRLFVHKRKLLSRRTGPFLENLNANQNLSRDELGKLNWERRKSIIEYAFQSIPYYRKKYSAAGFELGDLKSESDFLDLPILERQEVVANHDEILSSEYDVTCLPAATTGGTSGVPLKTYGDPKYPLHVISWRSLQWWGVNPSDNSGYLYRAVPGRLKSFLQNVVLFPTRRNFIAASEMSSDNMHKFYKALRTSSPTYLVGYVGAIEVFADFLVSQKYELPSLKAIWTTAAPLPQLKRQFIVNAFQCPVYTQYGSCEFYWIAAECKMQCGLHIASDIRHVDVVTETSPVHDEKFGDLIVTDMINHAFPLIRYRIGDRGRLMNGSCECGLPFPMMDYVRGRIADAIYLPTGGIIPGEYWTTIFDDYTSDIKSFQVYQDTDFSVTITFDPLVENYETTIQSVDAKISKILGNAVRLTFVRQRIDVNENGKTRFVVSKINKNDIR